LKEVGENERRNKKKKKVNKKKNEEEKAEARNEESKTHVVVNCNVKQIESLIIS
jgi:hypothetical protein